MRITRSVRTAAMAACLSMMTLAGLATGAAAEQVTVLRSTAPAYKAGDMLNEGQTITVPKGVFVEVMSISGVQARISDYTGPLQVSGRKVDTSRLTAVTQAVLGQGQGTTALGGMRGPSTTVAIDVIKGGHWCYAPGAKLVLTRGDSMARETMVMKNPATKQAETLKWSRYSVSQAWPEAFAPGDGASFTIEQEGKAPKTFTLHTVAEGMSPEATLFTFARNQCTAQLEETAEELEKFSAE